MPSNGTAHDQKVHVTHTIRQAGEEETRSHRYMHKARLIQAAIRATKRHPPPLPLPQGSAHKRPRLHSPAAAGLSGPEQPP